MSSRTRFLCLLTLFLFSSVIYAQTGGPMLSHYRQGSEVEYQSWAICQDDDNVMMFANIRGILMFDGQTEKLIKIPVVPYSLKFNPSNRRVYVGGDNNYGYLQKDEKGFYKFISMRSDSSKIGIISRIIFTDSTVWFYGDQTILRHQLNSGKLQVKVSKKYNKPFTGMFVTPRNAFINIMGKGLYRVESDTLFPIVTGYLLEDTEVLFCLPYDKKLVLLGLGDGSLSLFDGIKFYSYQIKDDGYLKNNSLSEGIVIMDSLYAFSTLDGGAMVVDKKSGKVVHSINYLNGLPDDEIFAIGADNNNGLWLSHQYGLTRAELMLPVANLSVYPGLKGNLINPLWFNNQLYVSTSEGVFYLAEVKNYDETEILVPQELSVPVSLTKPVAGSPQLQLAQPTVKTKRSVFARIFGKKYVPDVQPQSPKVRNVEEVSKQSSASPQYIRKRVSRLKSIDFAYRKVEGLTEKCRQLISTPQGILASTNRGLFVIIDHKAKIIVPDKIINFISTSPGDNRYFIAASDGYFYIEPLEGRWKISRPDMDFDQPLYSIVATGKNMVWAGGDDIALRIDLSDKPEYRIFDLKTEYPQRCRVSFPNDTLFVFTESGILFYNPSDDSLIKYQKVQPENGSRFEYLISQSGSVWCKLDSNWTCIGNRNRISGEDVSILKIFDKVVSINSDEKNLWIITGENQLYRIDRKKIGTIKPDIALFVRGIHNEQSLYFNLSNAVFESGDNNVYFEIVAPLYHKKNSVQYQYIVDGMMKDWSKWSSKSTINLLLPHGTYNLRVRAKDIWGNISEPKQLTFTIKTPFTKTTFFFILIVTAVIALIILIVRFRERQLQREKHILERKVLERTAEIAAQKQEITSSIEYAGRIQAAMLPMKELFRNDFKDHFIIFKPRDIVSGDFYWIGEDANHIFFTVADCTGHGVPGAFLSMLGISTLNEIITNKSDLHANTVLNLLRTKIKTSLHQTGKEGEAADGMDIAFCILHKSRKILEYAGAYNPLFICQRGEIKEYKADRMPIGIYVGEKESFTNFEINVSKGDIIYLFSDGITDQFGGAEGSKFKKSALKKLLSSIYHRPMPEQHKLIEEAFEDWRGKGEQIDDVTVLGVKI